MSISGSFSPYMGGYGMPTQASALVSPITSPSLLAQQSPLMSSGLGGSPLGGSPISGSILQMMLQIMEMMMMLMTTLLGGGMGGGMGGSLGGDPGTSGSGAGADSGSGSPPSKSRNFPDSSQGSPGGTPSADANNGTQTGGNAPAGNAQIVSGKTGFNSNVSVFCPVTKDQEASGSDNSNGANQGAGFWQDMNRKFNSSPGISLADAFDSISNQPGQQKVRTNAPENSFVKGGGGKILVIGGDNITPKECQAHAEGLAKAYGIPSQDVTVIPNCSPAQLKAKMQEMGQGSGQQVLVDVLAHGAKQAGGLDALGKGNGDQWLSGSDLKNWVNQYLSPSYKNVNLMIESCYSGGYIQGN